MKIAASKEIAAPGTPQPLWPSRLLVKEIIMRTEVGEIAVGDSSVTYLTGARIEKDDSRTFSATDLDFTELDLNKVYIVGTVPAAVVHWWALD
jgi:hypothetical protein